MLTMNGNQLRIWAEQQFSHGRIEEDTKEALVKIGKELYSDDNSVSLRRGSWEGLSGTNPQEIIKQIRSQLKNK